MRLWYELASRGARARRERGKETEYGATHREDRRQALGLAGTEPSHGWFGVASACRLVRSQTLSARCRGVGIRAGLDASASDRVRVHRDEFDILHDVRHAKFRAVRGDVAFHRTGQQECEWRIFSVELKFDRDAMLSGAGYHDDRTLRLHGIAKLGLLHGHHEGGLHGAGECFDFNFR